MQTLSSWSNSVQWMTMHWIKWLMECTSYFLQFHTILWSWPSSTKWNFWQKEPIDWTSFTREELINAIEKCNNSSASGSDKLTWGHIKKIVRSEECITRLIVIANAWIELGH